MILCVNSSPRKEATEYVMMKTREILDERGYETYLLNLREKEINFCKHCDFCLEEKECVFDDGMSDVYTALEEARGIVLATPVYNSGISAQLKAMMDRTRALMAKDPESLRGKIGMGITIGGDRMGGQEISLMQIHAFFILNGMIPVSGGSFGANLGATFWSKDSKEGVMKDKEGFKTLEKSIKRLAQFLDEYGRK
ncbi:Fe-S cluster protein [candidate division MSBL1 archaeon SCGC-AAA382A20]|uniref:Fe-S cluster protein n=1 Tax=candidate division MSBL1 archaeon SCGC-AAA382A20 TaxID=1698280 RepID=A0A133VKH2_9EURY|nr:Fe-S cluster protein [candidate division MSBL1 archaeon SCGC-AAA382A20]